MIAGLLPEVALAEELDRAGLGGAEVAVVLGSGLGAFAERLEQSRVVSFDELSGVPRSTVPGHAGRFVRGRVGGAEVLVQQGRIHLYEGHPAERVTRTVRAFARLGVQALLLTNAAGGLNGDWAVPSLMRITDHLNLQGRTPLRRGEGGRGTPYDAGLGARLDAAAAQAGVALHAGVYAGLLGPTYETPAEIRMLAQAGAHAVGMSTVCEATAAWQEGLATCGVSCISNHAAGITSARLDHAEVVEAGAAIAERFCDLLEIALPTLTRS